MVRDWFSLLLPRADFLHPVPREGQVCIQLCARKFIFLAEAIEVGERSPRWFVGRALPSCRGREVDALTVLEMDGELHDGRMMLMHRVVEDAPSGLTAADVVSVPKIGDFIHVAPRLFGLLQADHRSVASLCHILQDIRNCLY